MTGQPVTPAIDNLVLAIDGATGTVDDLVAGTERGLLLTCLWYIREVDPQTLLLTGLTRDGVYLVENGEITGAVNNFRFNESPVDLLRRFSARLRRPCRASAASGATTTSPGRRPPRCGCPTSTCRASPRPSERLSLQPAAQLLPRRPSSRAPAAPVELGGALLLAREQDTPGHRALSRSLGLGGDLEQIGRLMTVS